ncbi:hypothetical protein OO007_16600 [Cocleimonas sp. KMM 6892]|uniref:hypothetical protein n=1 Tax=unclassified Cocleimonas TaxID=2639732 RepID=UPI002DB8DD19|nr:MULTISPECIES: hypothetical protein [unclassified Cocleimonas]MEB8433859.1 hypothetical protein [Cocleimonas sp. KMM 6892]MEC4716670.1 hypothetical protein [Cocleimonas sp. KMM 6895]MEC4746175.1 hypothetical protein [Cocleimonas sp. KMM 6896]
MVKVISIGAVSLALLIGVGYFFTIGFVKPMSSDLSIIGQGKPVLVLAYENYSPDGGEALSRLQKVKGDYHSRLDFVVADLGTPQGFAFADRHKMFNGQAVFLKQNGEPLEVTYIPTNEQELRSQLDSKLATVE